MATKTPKRTPRHAHPATFEAEVGQVLGQLKIALAGVVAKLPGSIRRAADVQQTLGIDKTLAWQVFKFATASNPIAAGDGLPGSSALSSFLQAAGRKGVSQDSIREARSALEDFERLVAEHAGDRKTFDALLSGLPGAENDQIDLATRRQAFRCNSRICGVQVKTQLTLAIYQPNESRPDVLDCAAIRAMYELQRMRHDSACIIATTVARDNDGGQRHEVRQRPIDPEGQTAEGVDLMRAFCSEPLPELRSFADASGRTIVEVAGNNIGSKAAVTCVIGRIIEGAAMRFRDDVNSFHSSATTVRIPCEVLVSDMLIHEDAFGSIDPAPEARVYNDHRGMPGLPIGRECDLLPMSVSVERLGKGVKVLHAPDVPRYAELAKEVFDRLGWDPRKFDVYRCRIEYPIMPSTVVMQFDLPEKA